MRNLLHHSWKVFLPVLGKVRITEYDFADLITRPKEGDLIYFPLGERLFEIKRVES